MKIALIYGAWSSGLHGAFDIAGLYKTRGLTGSESSFFNTARGLAERGHQAVAFCDCTAPGEIDGVIVLPLAALANLHQVELDAAIAWNEPHMLAAAAPRVLKVCAQQLNDFGYCAPDALKQPALWVLPSEHHRQYLIREQGLTGDSIVIPNSVNLEHFTGTVKRDPHRVVWCSSPDRGLHHLLSMWPEIKARVPLATLRIFYRVRKWIQDIRDVDTQPIVVNARRARYVEEALARLSNPCWGVEVRDSVPNVVMARELMQASVLAYPCDPIRYTEGFGVSVLDACAAGCKPIISDADALPSVHSSAACVIPGAPSETRHTWVDAIIAYLNHDLPLNPTMQHRHAAAHSRQVIAARWETELMGRV